MCGRMFQTLPLRRLLQIARTNNCTNGDMHSASYNICPTTYIPVIKKSNLYPADEIEEKNKQGQMEEREQKQEMEKISNTQRMQQEEEKPEQNQLKNDREVTFMRWGQKTNFNMLINGRIQQLTSKRTFMKFIKNRCVVIMQGYYEWKQKGKPFSFKPKNSDHFLVAGLYTDQNQIIILTKDAIPSLAHIHERMPAMLSESQVELWLDPQNTPHINNIIQNSLLKKDKPLWKNIGFTQLGPHVNKRQQKSIKCLMTLEQYNKELDKKGLMKFWGPKIQKQKQQAESKEKQKQMKLKQGEQGNSIMKEQLSIDGDKTIPIDQNKQNKQKQQQNNKIQQKVQIKQPQRKQYILPGTKPAINNQIKQQ